MAIFWKVLIAAMRERGMAISCAVPPGDEESDNLLRDMGTNVIHYPLDRKGINPFNDLKTFFSLKNIFQTEKPDLLFATTIKPVIYGCLAAHQARVTGIFATITGLGYAFETDTNLKKIINRVGRRLYAASLRHASGVFFQNRDDARLFEDCGILESDANVMIARGTGVDTKYFAPAPYPPFPPEQPIIFLLVGRLLEAKGIRDYARAAAILRDRGFKIRARLLGPPETGRGSLDLEEIHRLELECGLEYQGQSGDVRPYIAASHVAVLPSWREGTPTAIMEAMSMARACVVTDVPGCREVVENGVNGWLVKCRDPLALANAMERFITDPDSIRSMGEKSRALAVSKFDAQKVAEGILEDMREHFPDQNIWPGSGDD